MENTMRKIINSTYVTIDGVQERLQDWHFQYHDDEAVAEATKELNASDAVLMGRATYDGFAVVWPGRSDEYSDRMNSIEKYVASTTLEKADWSNSTILEGDLIDAVTELKQRPGKDIISYGFGSIARALLTNGLLDEVRFWVHPILAGRADSADLLFRDAEPSQLTLRDTRVLGSGIVILSYESTTTRP
ncbi:MAG TPA: dihydrofolate reductase family protein [Galbitalea sp.]|jgi:dihydrofolate reductase|nr:dihydrofolate reductase family protein [Galbitalea sp.]